MLDNMKNSTEKPTLEELFDSKRLHQPSLSASSKFDDDVKIRTLNSFHSYNSLTTNKYLILFTVLFFSCIPFYYFLLSDVSVSNKSVITYTEQKSSILVEESSQNSKLSDDLSSSEFEYVENSYLVSSSTDYEKSFALKTMVLENDTQLYTSISLDDDTFNSQEMSHNHTF